METLSLCEPELKNEFSEKLAMAITCVGRESPTQPRTKVKLGIERITSSIKFENDSLVLKLLLPILFLVNSSLYGDSFHSFLETRSLMSFK